MSEGINPEQALGKTLVVAAKLPAVRINREAYLRRALQRQCSPEQVLAAIQGTPASAGVPAEVIERAARAAIKLETTKVTGISAAAGVPGGLAMLGTIPADAAQYFGHMLRISQKLAYLYSWPELFSDEEDEIDDATMNVFILFFGVMVGANAAGGAVNKLAQIIAEQVVKKLPQQALTKGVIYPLVKKVAAQLGVSMTKKMFAGGVAKLVPAIGAVLAGGFTLATFAPMSYKLKNHLAGSPLTTTEPDPAPQAPDEPLTSG
jgi:hypothetical protein